MTSRVTRGARIVAQAAVFLLLGAVMTCAVAVGIVRYGGALWTTSVTMQDKEPWVNWFNRHAPPAPEPPWRVNSVTVSWRPGWSRTYITAESPWHHDSVPAKAPREFVEVHLDRVGWPLACCDAELWGLTRITESGEWGPTFHSKKGFLQLGRPTSSRNYQPVQPLWIGLAINTGFYGLIMWASFVGALVWRRRLRIKRGLCVVCKYPVGSSAVCTECGTPAPRLSPLKASSSPAA